MLYPVGLLSGAQVEYKRVDLQSYEARNGAFLAQSFKYNFGIWDSQQINLCCSQRHGPIGD